MRTFTQTSHLLKRASPLLCVLRTLSIIRLLWIIFCDCHFFLINCRNNAFLDILLRARSLPFTRPFFHFEGKFGRMNACTMKVDGKCFQARFTDHNICEIDCCFSCSGIFRLSRRGLACLIMSYSANRFFCVLRRT